MGAHRIASRTDAGPGFASVLRLPIFARLFAAESQSIVGDQLARIALAVLVFDATGSAALTASVYALTFLPAVLSGVLAGGLADRWPRQQVMIGCDLVRAALYALMAFPGVPFPVVCGALVLAVFAGPVFTAAEVSLLAAALSTEQFRVATALRMMTGQLAQVGGFAVGGLLVALLEPRGALALNAASFVASALLVASTRRIGIADRVTGSGEDTRSPSDRWQVLSVGGAGRLLRIPGVGRLLVLSSLAGLFVVPEGLAVPFGHDLGLSTTQIGILLAAIPLGATAGIIFLVKVVGDGRRERALRVMAVGCGVPLVVAAALPGWGLPALCWCASGFLSAYQIDALAAMMRLAPAELHARLVGVGTALLVGAQGLGLIAFGALASSWSPVAAVATAGATGAVLALVIVGSPSRGRLLPA